MLHQLHLMNGLHYRKDSINSITNPLTDIAILEKELGFMEYCMIMSATAILSV